MEKSLPSAFIILICGAEDVNEREISKKRGIYCILKK